MVALTIRFGRMAIGSGLPRLGGYPFEVRYSEGSLVRARAMADIAADAYGYFSHLFSGVKPEIAVIVADEAAWESRQPYGLPYFNDAKGQISPGIVVMPASRGNFWTAMGEDLRATSPEGYTRLLMTYPDGQGGLDLQPFFDLVTIHELGHAFEVCGSLSFPTFWLGEIFANLCLHAFVATTRRDSLATLEVLSTVGVQSTHLDQRIRASGFSTLEELEAHYTGGETPMDPLNYIWYHYRWQRLAAAMFDADAEAGLIRFWNCFHEGERDFSGEVTPAALTPLLESKVSETLARGVRDWH